MKKKERNTIYMDLTLRKWGQTILISVMPMICLKRSSKIIAQGQEMLLSIVISLNQAIRGLELIIDTQMVQQAQLEEHNILNIKQALVQPKMIHHLPKRKIHKNYLQKVIQ